MINITWLRTFCTLVDVGHFTHTAERLHMTQSGVSQHISKLENQLDIDLLIRQGKQFSLTDAGQQLYQEAEDILQRLARLEQRIGEDPAYEGLVRLMSPGSVGLKLYPQLLTLQQQHPNLVIDYRFAPNADIERALAKLEIDIGFMTDISGDETVSCKPVAQEALILITPAATVEPSWEQLKALGFIDHPDGSHHASMLLSANYTEFQHINDFDKKGFSNQISLILEPVSRGLGFTVLPAHAVAAYPNPQAIKSHYLPVPVSETLYLAVRSQSVLPNRMQTVIHEVQKWL
ncbi:MULTISPECIES: LysR family transcriptional regulator [unclassified Psychrobacter]|uniref:LysR family transcriptional regulator n=1 Tax=unclassified Psychrobacter TaxID=196806 RepID=UPI0025B357D6|nr:MULTISPECIES: LysR family transcriptional regulator [unclassified Psychrobacter]MDN3453399.1 LysR family transcriptional regulator [Psychrobacter sp. APC 3350]MDN3502153.1 LysR family transcriptional regulator [Psychrobacter sp. 5A.1]